MDSTSDIVFVDTLRLSANIGSDCWGRIRPQPIEITVYLHLKPSFLQAAAESDDVVDSIHYGHLTKSIRILIKSKSGSDSSGFNGIDDLIRAVTACAFELGGEAIAEVRVVLNIPKVILLANGFFVDVVTARDGPELAMVSKKVSIGDIVVPVIIGVNPPEREAKQRVLVNITFHEDPSSSKDVDYPCIVTKLSKDMEASSYLTLEKFVMEIIRSAFVEHNSVKAVTARAQKPSALSFAQSSGVEITRTHASFSRLQSSDLQS
ncbi:hypothetical protein M413DRAFT_445214 [Hebeloma cylindrosporum]|uniref:dihydroneopterin aldolase n=1 Tax=Hebeloma cylindrosporum TaxID=76867 RepID=A0A0C2XWJ7_HEBCY|nr:hypothetical protein M413DRAFT_445214 [Hebeloma cylindrosporum h7]